jgi:HSP20 family protein
VDIFRTRGGWLLKFDLPGVRMEDVGVQIAGDRLTVAGVRHDVISEEGCTYYSMEISCNRFERTIELPADLEGARIQLEARDGILLVRITSNRKEGERG